MVLLHGLGGSHLNWEGVAAQLAHNHRVWALDMLGFGLTPLAGRRATMKHQRELVEFFIDEVAGGRATVVGNSMGGLIAMSVASHSPKSVEGLVLVDPALPIISIRSIHREAARRLGLPLVPWVGPNILRRYYQSETPEDYVDDLLALLCSEPDRIDAEARARIIEMIRLRRTMEWAIPAFRQASRSIARILTNRNAFLHMIHQIAPPTLVIHGEDDRIVPLVSAEWLADERPDWDLVVIHGVGHIPMIEAPGAFLDIIDTWLIGLADQRTAV